MMDFPYVESAAAAVAFAAFYVGLREYRAGQRWKKSELAAQELQRLSSDPLLSAACKMLDYSRRRMAIPSGYGFFTSEQSFVHEWETLRRGLVSEQVNGSFTWEEMLYRDVFDHFFVYLERVEHYISIGLLEQADMAPLAYWLTQLRTPRFGGENPFDDFIRDYSYPGVTALMQRFGVQSSTSSVST